MTAQTPRLRIAPSPTGEPHIGTAYTTLFNVLLAKKLGGEMILRVEDTDQSRSTPEAEAKLMQALDWLGLEWSEGPDKGGAYGPYRQSERKDIYARYVEQLVEAGHAFKCYCSKERLDGMREEQQARGEVTKYDGLCLKRDPKELAELEASGAPYVVRMKIPETGECSFKDGIYGDISIPYDAVDMQILQKADGMPTYHLANVVDDHLMKITHVARGEEWLSSTPKHILLYEYFGWEKPTFVHLPLMRGADRSKLSKRRNPTSLSYFESVGYLPQALINFLGLFFITIAEGEEVMDLDALVAEFDPEGVGKGGAIFDTDKLNWLNGQWIREKLSEEEYLDAVKRWAEQGDRMSKALTMARARMTVFGDLPDLGGFLFRGGIELTREDFAGAAPSFEESVEILEAIRPITDTVEEWKSEDIQAAVRAAGEATGRKLKKVMPTLFIAITGSRRSLPMFDSMAVLGRSVVRQRLSKAIEVLSAEPEEGGA